MHSFELIVEQLWIAFKYLDTIQNEPLPFTFESSEKKRKAVHLKCFLLKWLNAIKQVDLSKY